MDDYTSRLQHSTFTRNETTIPYLCLNGIYATRQATAPPPFSTTTTTLDTCAAGPHPSHAQHQPPFPSSSLPLIGANMIPSPPVSCPSPANFRYDIVLEAPPAAAAQRVEESPVTYLNKNQYYCINLTDTDGYDGVVTSTLTITFHEESHRRLTANYWRFWLGQQQDPQSARALDLNVERSSGIYNVQCPEFDRVVFEWNGKRGATIHVRFNCLSTDFSRIKGVKGIPLRLHMETQIPSSTSAGAVTTPSNTYSEATYCKIKLFRDKGAERKNKDDARHLGRQLEKLRGDLGKQGGSTSIDTHPLWLAYYRSQPYTLFSEIPESVSPPHPTLSSPSDSLTTATTTLAPSPGSTPEASSPPSSSAVASPQRAPAAAAVAGIKRVRSRMDDDYVHTTTTSNEHILCDPADIDPNYVPVRKRRTAKLAFFAKFPFNELYRAIYLDELTVDDLIQQLGNKMNISLPIQHVVRRVIKKDTGSPIVVRVDDTMVQDIPEEQDMEIETQVLEDGAFTLILHY
ncbi:hypothetical protein O0I10_003038 [Lichtheimia ornata]|uniref:Grh/CP2 DB domain-containing protein n=1 Tax=Lichtheimia ornata TaxID=688661 RepID=A0AAD7V9V8_9FUNG|nr:uncharacterized protein O0I10_003038 [Lichtheimia ornata]KAJ8661288.1 hypothetical protein O0I10_003038 [Lichtheimia ornata]